MVTSVSWDFSLSNYRDREYNRSRHWYKATKKKIKWKESRQCIYYIIIYKQWLKFSVNFKQFQSAFKNFNTSIQQPIYWKSITYIHEQTIMQINISTLKDNHIGF